MKAQEDFQSKEQYYKYLRTYFAALAMQGICATGITKENINHEYFAKQAVRYADELLKQLSQ